MSYQLIDEKTGSVMRLRDGANIPPDEGNRDWREYQEWVSLGAVPLPPSPPVLPQRTRLEAALIAKGVIAERDLL